MADAKNGLFIIRFAHSILATGDNVTSPTDKDHSAAKTSDTRSRLLSTGELPRGPECSKLPMQLSGVDIIHRAMHNGLVHVLSYAHNRPVQYARTGVVFH